MNDKSTGESLLENAYRLNTPDDNVEYYDAFAESYDSDFASQLGYKYPAAIADIYRSSCTDADIPIADIGCGTGLVASELGMPAECIDGMDISPAMLEKSRAKGLYRNLYAADLTGSLDSVANDYGAILSAGTFTTGHLGPEPLVNLLSIARSKALFVIGINRQHYQVQNFDQTVQALQTQNRIVELQTRETGIYAGAQHEHADDKALVLLFRKA